MVEKTEVIKPYLEKMLLPLVFTLHYLINVMFYYLGLCSVENDARELGFIVISVAFAIISGIMFLYVIKKKYINTRTWVMLLCVLLWFGVCFAKGIFYDGSSFIKSVLPNFVVFCVPALLVGVYAAKLRTEKHFVNILEKISFFVFPIALIYFNQVIFNCNPTESGRDLGIMTYMAFAYTLMPFLITLVIQFINDEELILPVLGIKIKHRRIIRGVMIFVYWLSLYTSGTRGAIVCVCIGLILIGVYRIIKRLNVKLYLVIVCLLIGMLAFNMFVWSPEGAKGIERTQVFVEELENGNFQTSNEDPQISQNTDEMVMQDAVDENVRISDRGTLYKLALGEFMKSPVLGMGPGAYTDKYHIYPHNVILEMLAELGIVGTLPLLIIIFYAIINILVCGWKDRNVMIVLLFFMIYAVRANISGSLWECDVLLCAIGYGVAYEKYKEKSNI